MMDEDDDPIVSETDVYLSQRLADQLYLYQYPIRPSHTTYDNTPVLAARIKPSQQRVEIEVPIDTYNAYYSTSKGEQIALNVDGAQNSVFLSEKMDKQVLSSIPSGIGTNKYAIGYYRGGQMHITPLKGIVHIRPAFSYLDTADTKQRKSKVVEETTEEEAKMVSVKFAKRESEEAKQRRMASFEYVNKKREDEHWVNLSHFNIFNEESEKNRTLLLANELSDANEFHAESNIYLKKLIPTIEEEENAKPLLPSHILSLADLKSMSLNDQVRALLCNAKVMKFTQILSFLAKETDPIAALRAVQQVAILVQGCWVIKSDILYPKDTLSGQTGVASEVLCRSRDYVLWRFTQNRSVIRKDIASVIKLHSEDVKEILEHIAVYKVGKNWEFKLSYDNEFVHKHQDVVQRQQMLWDAKFQQLCSSLNLGKSDLERKSRHDEQLLSSPDKSKRRRTLSGRVRTKSSGMSDCSDTEEIAALRNLNETNSFNINSHKSEYETNTKIENNTHNFDSDELDKELMSFCKEKLCTRYVVTLTEIKNLLALKLTLCPAGHILGKGVSEKQIEQSLIDCGAVKIDSSDEPTYAMPNVGDRFDPIRKNIVEILKQNKSVKIASLRKNIEDENGYLPSDDELKKILRDFCFTKGSVWCLKTLSVEH